MDDLVAMIRLYIGVLILGCGAFGIKYFFERRRFAEIKSLEMIANLPWREFEFFVVRRLEKE